MFAIKWSNTLSVESLEGAPLEEALALLVNIRLNWKGTSTLAYYENSQITTVKISYNIWPIRLFLVNFDLKTFVDFTAVELVNLWP